MKHIVIEAVTPIVDCGRSPAKRVAGDLLSVEADVLREGHALVRSVVRYRREPSPHFLECSMSPIGNDRYRGAVRLGDPGIYQFTVEAWTDRLGTFVSDFQKKLTAGRDMRLDVEDGLVLIESVRRSAASAEAEALLAYSDRIRRAHDPQVVIDILLEDNLAEAFDRGDPRDDAVSFEPTLRIWVGRARALVGAWYEMFPRSQGQERGRASTLREAEGRLAAIAQMGFDVLYLPPVHPVGVTHRKGRNNALRAEPGDPGSPWGIGAESGGHTAIEPSLGTLEDFDHFVAQARQHGLEVALDFAIQCSPDHPWVREHPAWFEHRADGSIRYAENPPKEYQDIYPLDFDTHDEAGLLAELHRSVLFWIDHGIRIFRVDNPHTKPVALWRWLIGRIQSVHPDVVFLSEAFTRPKLMKALAKAGFTQSYTYFIWRNTKDEITAYVRELTTPPTSDYFRPNFFVNTPDILPSVLQSGRRAAFKMRLALAGTLSPSYGIYSGFELCEHEALPGTEEYLNSEKYEIRVRDWYAPGNIIDSVSKLNEIRRANPALQQLTNLTFLDTDNDYLLAYCKATPDRSNVLLIIVNLDPDSAHHGTVHVPRGLLGPPEEARYPLRELLTGARYSWSERNYVRLDPEVEAAHIFRVERPEAGR